MSNEHYRTKMDKGWPLPEDHLPDGRVCVQFEIPDDRDFAAVVIGHIFELGKWWNWEKGGGLDRRATETAQLFRTAIHETLCVEKYREMGCKCEDKATFLHRTTVDGQLQISKDGGTTWEQDPTDPRLTAPELPKLPGTDDTAKRCQAASNVRVNMQVKADQIAADAEQWSSISTIIGALVGFLIFLGIIGSGGALTPIMLGIGAALLATGRSAFIAAMTDGVYDTFQCIVYCHLNNDGTLKPNGINAIKADIADQLTGIAVKFLGDTVGLMGEIGINNMAATGTGTTGDCTDCTDCGGCVSGWEAGYNFSGGGIFPFGTMTDPTDDGFTVISADRGDGTNEIRITQPLTGYHCCSVTWEVVSGNPDNIWFKSYTPCGEAPSYDTATDDPLMGSPRNASYMAFLGGLGPENQFSIKFTFAPPLS